jgi:endonuclease/exonuclease/phosphatase (EEP) superfamily protein YafD
MGLSFMSYKAYLLIGYAFLLIVHFALKDYLYPISVIFYAFPLPILILIGIGLCVIYRKYKRILIGILLLCTLLIFNWFKNYYFINKPLLKERASSILFWNVAKNKQFPLDIIIEKINAYEPNIVGLVEATYMTDTHKNELASKFPNYEFQILNGNMFIGIKGKINDVSFNSTEKSHKFNNINATINKKNVSILLVDVYASPFINKKQPLKTIKDYATNNNASFIIGDFNTPYESVIFEGFYENFQNFHKYSDGFTATWPYSIPLIELDQIFISNSMQVSSLKKFNYVVSDHQLLVGKYK